MKAMILAAGLGTRLKPWTLSHPKALVPVGGIPMLQRVMNRLGGEGFDDIVINIHHFGEQIIDFMYGHEWKVRWQISDEREKLLDTGGGLLAASRILMAKDDVPFLVHNVDILSNAALHSLMELHQASDNDITLLTSKRESSRKLIFNKDGRLKGWKNVSTGETRPDGFMPEQGDSEEAFSGIYVVGAAAAKRLEEYSEERDTDVFPVMDFFLDNVSGLKIGRRCDVGLELIDIGKPATLERAQSIVS